MAILKTCRSCASKGDCEVQRKILDAVAGLRVSSLLHQCALHKAPYRKGQAIWAEVMDAPYDENGPYPVRRWFPGHFLSVARNNTRAIVVIAPDVMDRKGEEDFIPLGKGVCKVTWARIEPRDEPDIAHCPKCDVLAGMECERDWVSGSECPRLASEAAA